MLRYRLASAVVLIPLIIGSVIWGGLAFLALVAVCLLIAGFEFFQMAQHAGHHPNYVVGIGLIALFLVNVFTGGAWLREILTAALVVSLAVALFWRSKDWIVSWGLTFVGALYIGVLGSYFYLMRTLPDGAMWTAIVLLSAWATDSGAYIAGHRFGRHGFFTSISPKKTWEGAIGGLLAATVAMVGFGWIVDLGLLYALGLGLGVGIAATIGDLAESVIKRQMDAKDSGAIVPGHGGMLDRMDSLLFAAVFAYYYLVWIVRV
ncbi:MAG: phosphatidate cytidylyltransferase [Chloroflexi bacterium]|nr:phosphatidate cytidylyltransferase [Chloroflexota bacterium]